MAIPEAMYNYVQLCTHTRGPARESMFLLSKMTKRRRNDEKIEFWTPFLREPRRLCIKVIKNDFWTEIVGILMESPCF